MISSDRGVVAIFGPPTPSTSPMVQSICSKFEIPYIQVTPTAKKVHSLTTLNFYPDHNTLTYGIATVVKHMHWNTFVVLYENNDGLAKLNHVLKIVKVHDVPIIIRQLGVGPDYRSLLKEIKNSTIGHIILDCSTDIVMDVLRQAKEVGFLLVFYSYLITDLDAHMLDFNSLNIEANITVLRLVDPKNHLLENAIRDWNQGEMNDRRNISIMANKVKTQSALLYDAVWFFTQKFKELSAIEKITTESLDCNNGRNVWR